MMIDPRLEQKKGPSSENFGSAMGFGGNPRVMKWQVDGAYFIVAEYIEGQTQGQR